MVSSIGGYKPPSQPMQRKGEGLVTNASNMKFDHPIWALYETETSFTMTPTSPMCVKKSLSIDKRNLKTIEHCK